MHSFNTFWRYRRSSQGLSIVLWSWFLSIAGLPQGRPSGLCAGKGDEIGPFRLYAFRAIRLGSIFVLAKAFLKGVLHCSI